MSTKARIAFFNPTAKKIRQDRFGKQLDFRSFPVLVKGIVFFGNMLQSGFKEILDVVIGKSIKNLFTLTIMGNDIPLS